MRVAGITGVVNGRSWIGVECGLDAVPAVFVIEQREPVCRAVVDKHGDEVYLLVCLLFPHGTAQIVEITNENVCGLIIRGVYAEHKMEVGPGGCVCNRT